MKTIWKRLDTGKEEGNDDFNMGSFILMILLFLTFIGTSFYILVTSYLEVS